jgi:hypothetical protein
MAWKPPSDKLLYFETCHLDPSALKFLKVLRKESSYANRQNPKPAVVHKSQDDVIHHMTADEALTFEELQEYKVETACELEKCKKVYEDFAIAIKEVKLRQ